MISITLQLDWKPNAQFAGILWAHHHGWYTRAGIDLTIVPWWPGFNQMDALESDANVIVSTEDNLHLFARAQGKPVKAIGTMVQFSGIGWMTLNSANIRSIADLKGKRIGTHPDGLTAIKVALAENGLNEHDVELVDVSYAYDELLVSKQFDAIQCYVIVEPFELARKGFDLHTLVAYEAGYQVYSQVFSTTERLIASQRPALVQFLRVSFDGWRAALAQPQAGARLVVESYLPEAHYETELQSLMAMGRFIEGDVGMQKLGWMTSERWAKSSSYLEAHHLLHQPLTPEEVMTNALMEDVYA